MHEAPSSKAVFFDAAHTLIRVEPSVGEVYARAARNHGVQVDGPALERLFRQQWDTLRRLHPDELATSEDQERQWWMHLVRMVFAEAAPPGALDGRFDAFFGELWETFATPEVWRVYDDVLPALDALEARGIRCAVVSNWDSRLHRLMHGLGLDERFAFVLTSAEAGWRKPGAKIFECALQRLGAAKEEALHVGDSVRDDMAGARNAGIAGVLLDRDGRRPEWPGRIETLDELPARV